MKINQRRDKVTFGSSGREMKIYNGLVILEANLDLSYWDGRDPEFYPFPNLSIVEREELAD